MVPSGFGAVISMVALATVTFPPLPLVLVDKLSLSFTALWGSNTGQLPWLTAYTPEKIPTTFVFLGGGLFSDAEDPQLNGIALNWAPLLVRCST